MSPAPDYGRENILLPKLATQSSKSSHTVCYPSSTLGNVDSINPPVYQRMALYPCSISVSRNFAENQSGQNSLPEKPFPQRHLQNVNDQKAKTVRPYEFRLILQRPSSVNLPFLPPSFPSFLPTSCVPFLTRDSQKTRLRIPMAVTHGNRRLPSYNSSLSLSLFQARFLIS